MTWQIRWSQRALDRLQEIGDFLARRSPSAARRTVNDLLDRVEALGAHPHLGVVFPGATDPSLRQLHLGRYRVIYRVRETLQRIDILTLQHAREAPLTEGDLDVL